MPEKAHSIARSRLRASSSVPVMGTEMATKAEPEGVLKADLRESQRTCMPLVVKWPARQ